MAAFSALSFSTGGFSTGSFDFGNIAVVTPPVQGGASGPSFNFPSDIELQRRREAVTRVREDDEIIVCVLSFMGFLK
jgi:hypothetical protein